MNIRRVLRSMLILTFALLLVACGGSEDRKTEGNNDKSEKLVFGMTSWTSTEVPTHIVKKILEKVGYEVEFVVTEQPIIFSGLVDKEVDFFMDAWLPHTEKELWEEYGEKLEKVAVSYQNAPLGWVVPTYVEEDSILDIKENSEKFDGKIYAIDSGAGITVISDQMKIDYELDDYEVVHSSETAMMSQVEKMISNEEPVIFVGWRPHSMFARYDLKFLEDPLESFKEDSIYVISYKGIQEKHPKAYNVLSNWSIEISDLEDMMLQYEQDGVPIEQLAQEWIDNNEKKVQNMIDAAED